MGFYSRQEKLDLDSDMSISIIGAGGIGFWVGKFAAMSGIKDIYVYDDDIVEESNLNRLDIPMKFIGKNKADMVGMVVKMLRPNCNITTRPFKYQKFNAAKTDWVIDATDNYESQLNNQEIAKSMGARYVKAGYDGESFSINDRVAEWGESEDGYQITPSWVVPASIVAALTVAKIMKYCDSEVYGNVGMLMNKKG
jgi:molybdopterin/thiamine biosynthesis adenylyltransferase